MTLDEIRKQLQNDIQKADAYSGTIEQDASPTAFIGFADGLRKALGYLDMLDTLGNQMIEVPCQVGDRLWCLVGSDCSVVMEMTVDNIFINKLVTVVGLSGPGKYQEILAGDIGKTAFWSQEEAIAAKDECLRVVDDLLQKASEKSEELYKGNMGAFLDVMDDRFSGLLEEF